MPSDCITYQSSGYFTPLIVDYLNQADTLKQLYNRFPTLENFKAQLEEKQKNYDHTFRSKLADELELQYKSIAASAKTKQNIAALWEDNTYTITTGHQLNLFTGPLYFLYKIVSTINLTKELKAAYPAYNFIPVYWMATEDHDFEEINYFTFRNKKIKWPRESAGPVGRLSTYGLDAVLEVFKKELGAGDNAAWLVQLFTDAYINHSNLADATRYIANQLFADEGLVIIDADTPALKKLFIPHIKEELLHQTSHYKVEETAHHLKGYNIQVNPREINLFYIEDNLRERIILQDGKYFVNNTEMSFSESEILELVESHPERFSPNVIMRPLYQEVILPNLCYIGGGGEIAYWLELKSYFESARITFPMLLVRNSVLLATEKQAHKAEKLNLTWADLFSKQRELVNKKTAVYSEFNLDFTEQKQHLAAQFDKLERIAAQTDKSFTGAVQAQKEKQLKGLENLEKRLLKAEKRSHTEELDRITTLQNELFPNKGLQERQANFSEFYLEYDGKLLQELLGNLKPLKQEFSVIVL
ncbi:MAG: bacillithiol biosynthesis cysteine-adding enzyme BshC [Flavobacterium sp.]